MSFANYEWYGWLAFLLAISATFTFFEASQKDHLEGQALAPALMITLALWLATP